MSDLKCLVSSVEDRWIEVMLKVVRKDCIPLVVCMGRREGIITALAITSKMKEVAVVDSAQRTASKDCLIILMIWSRAGE